ncbi:MAG TPA: response regulator [Parvularculaceae bacterium]|nr:response regulator [Parvularculaceae bacterium]
MCDCVHIIEADPSVRNAIEELVLAAGLSVRAYPRPEAFFETAPIALDDVVILDLAFPSGSSIDAALRLKREHPDVKIVVVSGARQRAYQEALAAIAPDAGFRKPLDGEAFFKSVSEFAADK